SASDALAAATAHLHVHTVPVRAHTTLFPYTTLFRSLACDQRTHGNVERAQLGRAAQIRQVDDEAGRHHGGADLPQQLHRALRRADRKSTRLNSSHVKSSYAVFCLKKKTIKSWSLVAK